ncbi:unnamed protein product, partial [Discosporangium mesarthrocarpum]
GEYEEAEPLYHMALAIDENVYVPDRPVIASNLNNLAGQEVSHLLTHISDSRALVLTWISIWEVALSSNYPQVAKGLTNLTYVFLLRGKYDEAESLHGWAINIRKKMLAPDHPDLALLLKN